MRTDGLLPGNVRRLNFTPFLTPARQAGIGTYTSNHAPGFINSVSRRVTKVLDQALAWSLPLHTQGA